MLKRKLPNLDADAAAAGGVCEAKLTTFRFFGGVCTTCLASFKRLAGVSLLVVTVAMLRRWGLAMGLFRVWGQIPCGTT